MTLHAIRPRPWQVFVVAVWAVTLGVRDVGAQAAWPFGFQDSIRSTRLAETMKFRVVLPDEYSDPGSVGRRFPIVILWGTPDEQRPGLFSGVVTALRSAGGGSGPAVPGLIIVRVAPGPNSRYDYPPAKGAAAKNYPTAGGADGYAEFLVQELLPLLRERYRTMPYTVIAGHSSAGQFAIRAFALFPDVFQAAVGVSPALWWNDEESSREYSAAILNRHQAGRLYVTSGGYDPGGIRVATEHFVGAITAGGKLPTAFAYRKLPEDSHFTTPMPGTIDGLRWVFEPMSLARDDIHAARALPTTSPADLMHAYDTVKQRYALGARELGFPPDLPGYYLRWEAFIGLGPDRIEPVFPFARRLCEDDVTAHPTSPDAHECLSRALLGLADTVAARASLVTGLEMAKSAGDASAVNRIQRRLSAIDSARTPRTR